MKHLILKNIIYFKLNFWLGNYFFKFLFESWPGPEVYSINSIAEQIAILKKVTQKCTGTAI